MNPPTVGLALIARNEADQLPRLLESVAGAFDQIVLVDTGSTDDTVDVFWSWAADQPATRCTVERFEWCDDFAAARTYADRFLETDWTSWADCDDTVAGALNLRQLAADAPDELAAYIVGYIYARDGHGNTVCHLKRERLVRRGKGTWHGRVHEAQAIDGHVGEVPADMCQWIHWPVDVERSSRRNLKLLRAWAKAEPENPRVLAYLGTETAARGRHKAAVRYFRRYLRLKTTWDEERAQVHRRLALSLMALNEPDKAIDVGLEALRLLPSWPDSYLTLAEAHYTLGEHAKAIDWADQALARGVPQTLLIINPQDYVLQPLVVKAAANAALGQLETAVELADQVLAQAPGHPLIAPDYPQWRALRKRDSAADMFVSCAQVLAAHDEQLKALQVLEAAPHFATDHPAVVAARSQLRERLNPLFDLAAYADHYETGGSKPEDYVKDEDVLPLGDYLPRCGFLLQGLHEQLEERQAVPA